MNLRRRPRARKRRRPIKIHYKHIRDMALDTTYGIIGPRASGKTVFIQWWLYYNHKRIRYSYVISATAGMEQTYEGQVPGSLVYEDYDKESIGTLLDDQAFLVEKLARKQCDQNIRKSSVVILDDIIGTSTAWKRDKDFKKILFAGRHMLVTNIISVQNAIHIPSEFRDNLDYVVIMNMLNEKAKKDLYDHYWNHGFGDRKLMDSLLKQVFSQKFTYLVLDNYAVKKGHANTLQDYVFFGKCHDPKFLPRNKWACNKKILDAHRRYYNKNWHSDSIRSVFRKNKESEPVDVILCKD